MAKLAGKPPDGRKLILMSQTRARITIVGGVETPALSFPQTLRLAREDEQKGIPTIARQPELTWSIEK